jgi:CopG-like RHH_1 or ribbon-helix-helix domain, RHH_5
LKNSSLWKGIMSKRIQVTLPNRLAKNLESWADYDGRPLSNLAAYLLERAVADALFRLPPLGVRKIAPKTRKLETSTTVRQY